MSQFFVPQNQYLPAIDLHLISIKLFNFYEIFINIIHAFKSSTKRVDVSFLYLNQSKAIFSVIEIWAILPDVVFNWVNFHTLVKFILIPASSAVNSIFDPNNSMLISTSFHLWFFFYISIQQVKGPALFLIVCPVNSTSNKYCLLTLKKAVPKVFRKLRMIQRVINSFRDYDIRK